jgi:DnaJ-class molecular chaperone
MAGRDYYLILGVDRGETPRGIRAAYLDLAKRHHPDHAGQAATPEFQTIAEAYETLSNTEKRRTYDATLDESAASRPAPPRPPDWAPLRAEPIDVLDTAAGYRPSFGALQERYLRNFVGAWAPKGELVEGLNLEVLLSTEEAMRGVLLPLEVPTLGVCAACDGSGYAWPFPCSECRQLGRVLVPKTVHLHIPPLMASGRIHEIPLDSLGIHNFYLRVHVVVDG